MFPLAGDDFPATAGALSASISIEDAIREVFTLPKSAGVTVEGATRFPHVSRVGIDLSGAKLAASEPPPKPVGVGKRKPGITVDKLEVVGRPIHYERAKLELDLRASGLTFDFDRDRAGRPLLVLTAADEGHVEATIKRADIEALLLAVATAAAKQQGVTVQELELSLTSGGPRSVAADVRIKAKKLMMSGVIRITGAADVDDELNATLSGLTCTGEGLIGGAAAGLVQKHLKAYDGKRFPLMAFSLGDVALRDLELELNGALHVSAAFGKAAKTSKKSAGATAKRK